MKQLKFNEKRILKALLERTKVTTMRKAWKVKDNYSQDMNGNETSLHRDTKYERWKHHKELGRYVFCELRLREPYGIPDLVVVDNGFIFIEEIVVSEKKISLVNKKKKYPWPINIIHAKRK